jgi:hypothetical protein
MFKVQGAQLSALLEEQKRKFVSDFFPILYEEFPELWTQHEPQEISKSLGMECDRALRYDVQSARGIYILLTLRLRLGSDFPEGEDDAWAREILARDFVPESERIAALEAALWGSDEE